MTSHTEDGVDDEVLDTDIYGMDDQDRPDTFSSGCTLLDAALGGGWAERRIANVIGDHSTGKTLLAIEAMANFKDKHPSAVIYYAEAEAAFDDSYAKKLGMPDGVEKPRIYTAEQLIEFIDDLLASPSDEPTLFILDSVDALSDNKEMKRDVDAGSYNMDKSKMLSKWMRKQNQAIADSNITIMLISQVRENIGVTFGRKYRRSGGKALDFYATHCVWLSQVGKIEKTKQKVPRVVGVKIRANVDKCKIGPPHRKVDFPLYFMYGVEDVEAGLNWLHEIKCAEALGYDTDRKVAAAIRGLPKMSDEEYDDLRARVNALVRERWESIEEDFAPKRRKYR